MSKRAIPSLRNALKVSSKVQHAAAYAIGALERRVLFCAVVHDDPAEAALHFDAGGVAAVDAGNVGEEIAPASVSYATNGMPELNSNPNAFAKLFIDFDGGLWQDQWYRPYAIDGDDTTFNAAEQASITEQWQRISEAFSPFNINVTTVDPGNLNERETGTIVVAGNAGGGGFGYVGGFYNGSDNKGITFTSPSTQAKTAAYISIHEAGHVLGLWHQSLYDANGVKLQEYYSGNSIIAPIMGSAYHPQRAIWWNGPSSINWQTNQDDLAIISGGNNAFGYRPDDHGTAFSLATPIGSGSISGGGIIERTSDTDFFSFNASAGTINLTASVMSLSPTLDLKLELYEWTGSGYSTVASASTAALSESLSFATDGGMFALAVRSQGAYGDVGQYTLSGNVPAYTYALAAPTGVAATAINTSTVSVTWEDNSTDETGFDIMRSSDDGETWELAGSVGPDETALTDVTAVAGEVYWYRVTAMGVDGDSEASAPARAVTFAAPSGLTVGAVLPTKVTLSWTDDVAGETGFLIEKSSDGGLTWNGAAAASPNMTSVTVSHLAIETTYQFRVRANFDGVGYGVSGNTVGATTTFGAPPAAPAVLTVTPDGPYRFILNWSNVDDETGFLIERSNDGVNWTHLRTNGMNNASYYDTHNSPGTTFHYRVRAFNDVGRSGYSPVAVGTSENVTIPTAPTMLRAINVQGITGYLQWNDNSNSETGFRIEIEMWNDFAEEWSFWDEASSTGPSWSFSGLSYNFTYRFRVYAWNAMGESEASNDVTATTGPVQPTGFNATRTSANSVSMSWNDVNLASEYLLQRSVGTPWDFQTLATLTGDVNSFVDNTAGEFESYTYRVIAVNSGSARSQPSTSVTIATAYAPQQAPTGVTAIPSGKGIAVRISWNDVTGENEYYVDRSLDGDDWESLGWAPANWTKWDDWDVQLGQTYYYRVRAINPIGSSPASETVTGSPQEIVAPPAPTNVRVLTPGTNELRLGWDIDPNLVWNVFIERYNPTTDVWEEIYDHDEPEFPAATDLGLSPGTVYSYRIRGYNQTGYGPYSDVLTTATLTLAPSGLTTASVTPTSVTLNWSDVAGEESYSIERTLLNANNWSTVGASGLDITTFTDTTVASGTNYQYRVRAINRGGSSAASPIAYAFVPAPIPATPTGLNVTSVLANRVNLQWNDVANETSYRIQRSIDGANWSQVGTTAADVTAFGDNTAASGTTYQYRVVAANSAGASAPSSAVTATTIPAAPTGLTATPASVSQVNLAWGNVTGETGYVIERSVNGTTWSQVGTTLANVVSFSDTTAAGGTTYQYRVAATNASGRSANSATATATTIPVAPTGLTATAASATQVNLSWNNVTGETSYVIERSLDGTVWGQVGTRSADVTTFSDTTAAAGTAYQYRVAALNATGRSANSATAATTTIPAAPGSLTATAASATQINLSWGNVAGETGYIVERSPDGSTGWAQVGTTGVNVTTFQNTGLSSSTPYWYRVRASNASGQSTNSNTATATTLAAPPATPGGLTATAISSTQIQLNWTDVAGETTYLIERSATGTSGWTQVGTTAANVTTFTNSALKKNTRYYYRIRAANSAGNSGYSVVVNAVTLR